LLQLSVLTVFTYWALAKPSIHRRLIIDLDNSGINVHNLKWVELEKVPYFWAILHECLRMMPGVSQRSARIAPGEDLHYKSADGKIEWLIPRGTPIGMTSMINHWNTDYFPSPPNFLPERWLLPGDQPNHQLQKKLITFGRGSRNYIGEK
jgi:cytochrome P450